MIATALVCSTASVKAEYRLNAGDVIEVVVAGIPAFKQRVMVQMDGSISLPLLGTILVSGSTSAEARAKIKSALATKIFRQAMSDGRERTLVIKFDEVAASIVEYRPIYVNGAVSRPGEQTFRPRITVRQAVAAAGGYEFLRFGARSTVRDAIELQADFPSQWVSFAREQARVWRLKSELGDTREFDRNLLKNAPLSEATVSEIINLEAEQLKVRAADFERGKAFLRHAIGLAEQHITALKKQQLKENKGAQADIKELDRVSRLFKKGNIRITRVTEARRAVLLSSTRLLQTGSRILQVARQRGEVSRKLEKLEDRRRIALLGKLQDAGVKLKGIEAKLRSIGEALRQTSAQPTTGLIARKPQFTVFRIDANGETGFIAKGDTELQPGDVVEVVLRAEDTEVAAQ